ncbi:hypothetical protein ALC57_03963 [Trachymyrmex cornetzi]|uniref:Uncharacterized protein n=1 Tax=Trachymyrmex cornetzi TaxID=471704 RepID=A0A151JM98_9HYME|nr:hypothetical protein ALC57_03963 [Trachymyrmex cornetzi]
MQQLVTQLVSSIRINNADSQGSISTSDLPGPPVQDFRPVLSTVPVAQAVNLLTSQLPSFSGLEDENVDICIEKVECTINDSWTNLKQAISGRFRRDIPYHVTFQKGINFLISGIGNASIRASASMIQAESLDQFLEKMHVLPLAYGNPKKLPSSSLKMIKNEVVTSEKVNSFPDSSKDLFCVYFRTKGHVRDDCARLKRKEQNRPVSSSTQSSSVVSIEESPSFSAESSQTTEPSPSFSSHVAYVESGSTFNISDNIVKVTSINDISCSLDALIDTGSAVSLIPLMTSPSKLLLGYDQRNNSDANLIKLLNEIANINKDFSLEREKSRELALNIANKIKFYNKQEGRENVNDEPRFGRPSMSKTDENVQEVKEFVLKNRRITIREIADDLNISFGSCQSILTDVLGMTRVSAKFVPKLLNFDQKQRRMNIAQDMLNDVNDDPDLLKRL